MNLSAFLPAAALIAALALISSSSAKADPTNLALNSNGGVALFGFNSTGDSATLGTLYDHAGSSTFLNDGLTTTGGSDDTFGQPNNPSLSFIGATFAPSALQVQQVVFYGALFGDGGWFGKNATNPDGTSAPPNGDGSTILAAAGLIAPQVQFTIDGGVTWTDVSSTNDYVSQFTGLPVGGASPTPAATFDITGALPTNVDGIRLIGTSGGYASGGGGFLGAREIEVLANAVPEPSTYALMLGGVTVLLFLARRGQAIARS